jgi:superfamily I DNA/RNA helicase
MLQAVREAPTKTAWIVIAAETVTDVDLSAADTLIYIGDPYQQIYEWRGAVNAMAQIDAPERALTEILPLRTHGRCARQPYSGIA